MCVCKVAICNLSLHHPAHLPDNVNGTGRGLSHTMLITTAASVAAAFVVLTMVQKKKAMWEVSMFSVKYICRYINIFFVK